MVKRNCTRARTRVRHSVGEGNLAVKPNLIDCTRDLLEIKLRLETVLEAVAIAVDVLNAQVIEIDNQVAIGLRRSVCATLTEPIGRLSQMIRRLEGVSKDDPAGALNPAHSIR
jgi:hypothetical protein